MLTGAIDMQGYELLVHGLRDALVSQGGDGDLSQVIKDESRHLAMELSRRLGPKTLAAGTAKIRKDVKEDFAPMPPETFTGSKTGSGGIRWLYAGPDFLVGVERERYEPGRDVESAIKTHRYLRGTAGGPSYTRESKRGRQNVMLINRIVIARKTFEAMIRRLAVRVGRMRASIAYTAHQFGENRIPQWISRHFDTSASSGKAIFNPSGLSNGEAPVMEFGSRSPGVERYSDAVNASVEVRKHKIRARIKRLLSGYADNQRAGQRPQKQAQATQSFSE